jgi:endoglucanase
MHSLLGTILTLSAAVQSPSVQRPVAARDDAPPASVIRVNQLGYLPNAPKTAVLCVPADSVAGAPPAPASLTFTVEDTTGRRVFGPQRAATGGLFGPCAQTYRLDFSSLRVPGRYRVVVGNTRSPVVRIDARAYAGAADTLLYYMRQQRSGYNPTLRDSVHTHDGIIVDHPTRTGEFINVSGGWADAADYLQYVTTSATATYVMLKARREFPHAFADRFAATGLPGANGVDDALDEARHGLEWLLRMFPDDSTMFNQLADDRDHTYFDLPTSDSADYGWGKGKERPVYPCTGKPQGLFAGKNRATGYASTAGKYAATFALASRTYASSDPAFARRLRDRALAAYALGVKYPGNCQTAPGKSPYFYEEENWADDMELGAAELYALTREQRFLRDALGHAAKEPVTPWMGADTARHYEWYPWINHGHDAVWRVADARGKRLMADYYRQGLERVAARAKTNGFRVGIPFIWCSNNLMSAFATQALIYRRITGDERFREYEAAALDWLFGANPWGTSMVIGLPWSGTWPHDPHSVMAKQLGVETQLGGLVDGPVYRSIFGNLKGIRLIDADEYAPFNTGFIVYHDDLGDYSTNEPIMDGTAMLTYLLAALAPSR